MKRASHWLAYMDAQSVTDIAMDAGYDAPDAFARAIQRKLLQKARLIAGRHQRDMCLKRGAQFEGPRVPGEIPQSH